MPDMAALLSGNPYLAAMLPPEDTRARAFNGIGDALIGMGAGIAGAGAQGQPFLAGVAPGALMASGLMGRRREAEQQERTQLLHFGLLARELQDKEDAKRLQREGMAAWANSLGPGGAPATAAAPGIDYQPPPYQLGPTTAAGRTAQLEGGSKNGGMVYNELGSGAFGPYQIMPGTWQDIRKANPDLDLPADITQATRAQHDAAKAVFDRANGAELTKAGIDPTPTNLYLAHRFGAAGATKMLKAAPDAMLSDVLPVEWQRQNPDMRGQTVAGFQRLAAERMGGVGTVPYQADQNAKPTPYAITPSAVPGFEVPGASPSLAIPGTLPAGQPPALTAPVMPTVSQPGPTMTAQLPPAPPLPTGQVAQGDTNANVPTAIPGLNTPPPAMAPPPTPPVVPRPQLSPQDAASLRALAATGTVTVEQLEAHKNKLINEQWTRDQTRATQQWQEAREQYRFERGESAKRETWQPMTPQEVQQAIPGANPKVQYQRNARTGQIQPIRDSKDLDKDVSGLFDNEDINKVVAEMSPADQAAYRAALALGKDKEARGMIKAQQQLIPASLKNTHGQEFLKTRSIEEQGIVNGLVEGRILPSDLSKRSDEYNHFIKLAVHTDPAYTPNDAGARRAFETRYMVNGNGANMMQSANTALMHMRNWRDAVDAVQSGDNQLMNKIVNQARATFGNDKVPSAQAAAMLYGSEVARAVHGGGALSLAETEAARHMVDGTVLTPKQATGVANTLTDMLMGRVHIIEDTARMHGVPEDKVGKYLFPQAREAAEYVQSHPIGAPKGPETRPPLESLVPTKPVAGSLPLPPKGAASRPPLDQLIPGRTE